MQANEQHEEVWNLLLWVEDGWVELSQTYPSQEDAQRSLDRSNEYRMAGVERHFAIMREGDDVYPPAPTA